MPLATVTHQSSSDSQEAADRAALAAALRDDMQNITAAVVTTALPGDHLQPSGVCARLREFDKGDLGVQPLEVVLEMNPGDPRHRGDIRYKAAESALRLELGRQVWAWLQTNGPKFPAANVHQFDFDVHFTPMCGGTADVASSEVLAHWGGECITGEALKPDPPTPTD